MIENNQSGPNLKFVLVYNIIVILKISFKNFAIRVKLKYYSTGKKYSDLIIRELRRFARYKRGYQNP